MTYTHLIFPERRVGKQRGKGGILMGFRVVKNGLDNFYAADQTKSLRLDAFKGSLMQEGWDYTRELNDVDGNPMPDDLQISINDSFTYAGTSDGTPVSVDLTGTGSSLLDDFFSDDSATYTGFFTKIEKQKATNGVTNGTFTFVGSGFNSGMVGRGIEIEGKGIYKIEAFTNSTTITLSHPTASAPTAGTGLSYWVHQIWFIGDVDPKTITRQHFLTHAAHTADAYRYQGVDLAFTIAAHRMQDKTLGAMQADATYKFGELDMKNEYREAFYGGSVFKPGVEFGNQEYWDDLGYGTTFEDETGNPFQNASYGAFPDYDADVFPKGMWGVTFATILQKAADYIRVSFDPDTCIVNKFVPYYETYDDTAHGYVKVKLCDADVALQTLCVNYNFTFGHSYLPSTVDGYTPFFECPVSFSPDATMDEIVQAVCDRFGLSIMWEYDHALFMPIMQVIDRKTLGEEFQNGTDGICEGWTFRDSNEDERDTSKQRVKLGFLADDGGISCPKKNGDSVDIEIRWRTRSCGAEDELLTKDFIFDPGLKSGEQFARWYATNQDQDAINPDGWFGGTLMYHYHPSATALPFYPDWKPSDGYTSSDWSGFYPIAFLEYEGGTTVDPETVAATHPLNELCRYFADEIVGDKVVLNREYYGVLDNNGNIGTVRPLITMQEAFRGDTLTFKAERTCQKFTSTVTPIRWVGVTPSADWKALPVFLDGEAGMTTGGSSSSGTGQGTSVAQPYLRQKPTANSQNTATSQIAGVVPITTVGFLADTANLASHQQNAAGTPTTVAGVTYNGISFAKSFACNVTSVSATYQILSTDGCVIASANTFTATLIAAPIEGQCVTVSNQGAGTITVARSGSQTINGVTTSRTLAAGLCEVYRYDGTSNWVIEATYAGSGASLTGAIIIDPASDTRNVIQATAGTVKALVVKAHGSQTDSLQEWQSSAGAAESYVDSNRRFNSTVDVMFDNGNDTNVSFLNSSTRVWATQGAAGTMALVVTAHPTPSTDIVHVETDGGSDIFRIAQDYTTTVYKKFIVNEQTINTSYVVALGGANASNLGIGDSTLVELSSTAAVFLNSIAGGANGRIIRLVNTTGFNITLTDNDIPSVAVNRFRLPSGNLVLAQYEGATFVWTTTNQRWCRIG